MALVYDLYINRECEDCTYGELDVLAGKYYCTLHERHREPDDRDECPDIRQR